MGWEHLFETSFNDIASRGLIAAEAVSLASGQFGVFFAFSLIHLALLRPEGYGMLLSEKSWDVLVIMVKDWVPIPIKTAW